MARRGATKGAESQGEPSASTLAQIREKELEFDGLVMVARSEAESRISAATDKADAAVREAQAEAERLVKTREAEVMAAAQADADAERTKAAKETERMREMAQARRGAAVAEILKAALGS